MISHPDNRALGAMADALADAVSVYRKAGRLAEDEELGRKLAGEEEELRRLNELVTIDDGKDDGSIMASIDRFRLRIDSLLGDKDEAAALASDDARLKVLGVADDILDNQEISAGVKNVVEEVRYRLGGARTLPDGENSSVAPQPG